MMLSDFFTACVALRREASPDGLGGVQERWTEGEAFYAGIALQEGTEHTIADQNGLVSTYTILVSQRLTLRQDDRIRRLSDGKVFRVTADGTDRMTPDCSLLGLRMVTGEAVQQ